MSFQRIAFQLRNSLWFIPALWVMGAGCLAILATWIDSVTPAIGRDLPLVFGGGPDGARSVLSSIAGSTITVAGVTFSITIVALQLASSQFSPRVLRDFMRDRLSQSVLGSFIGTFFYSLVVLRSIRSADETGPEFVPAVAVTLGIAFAVLAVAMLVYFIHHISTRIQVSSIVAGIAHATERAIERAMEDDGSYQRVPEGERQHGLSHAERPDGEPGRLPAATSGYLQLIDRRGIVATTDELDLVVRLELRPGDWVQEGAPLFVVWPAGAADDELADRLHERVTIGAERSLEQDPAFGLRQLVDVAVKALSPGINDPTTARECIGRITQVLAARGRAGQPHFGAASQERMRLAEREQTFAELVGLGFDELRHYGASTPEVAIALASSLATLRGIVPPSCRPPVTEQLERLREAAGEIRPAGERARVLARITAVAG
jgi:uncharacterized membrane protein